LIYTRNISPLALHVATTREAPKPVLPEAPCSINGHINIAGTTVQITGRGANGEEAAHNFKATLAAMQPVPAPEPVPPTREQRLAALLACGLAKAVANADMPLVERLAKAAALVLADAIEPGNRAGLLAVRSQSNPATYYEVDGKHCTCPDSERHQERACKHVLAVALVARLA
jgi:hypothetical protein